MPVPRTKSYTGPALLSYGFRPFFLFAAAYTALSMLLWPAILQGELEIATGFAPVDWHVHEWLFGFLPAVITGFLFTAVPNWTGRMPLQGLPLAILLLVWLAGRLAVSLSSIIGWELAAAMDAAFLALVTMVIAREIIAGKNWRNLKVLIPVCVLLVANAGFHFEAALTGTTDITRRLGIAGALSLIILIGGRIIPSFTRNWLAKENPGRLPAPFGSPDVAAILISVVALAGWVVFPETSATGALLLLGGAAQLIRMSRWAGHRTLREPLVLILHVSYAFVPIGLLLLGASIFSPATIPTVAGVHALSAGAIGGMTLSVMTRATLGHTGHELKASAFTIIIFASVIASAIARILQALSIGNDQMMLYIAASGWIIAFGGFAISFAPALLAPRKG